MCVQTFSSEKVNTPPGTHFPRDVSFGTRALVFVAALSKYFWDDSFMVSTFQQRASPTVLYIPRHRARLKGKERRKAVPHVSIWKHPPLHQKEASPCDDGQRVSLFSAIIKAQHAQSSAGDRRLAQPAQPWRPVTESAVSCPLEFSTGPVTLGLGKAHWPPPSLLTSRNAQAPHCSILPTPGTKRQTLYEHGNQRKKDPNPHQDTASSTIFKNKKLEIIGEWLSRRPRIRIKSYTAIEHVSTEAHNPSVPNLQKVAEQHMQELQNMSNDTYTNEQKQEESLWWTKQFRFIRLLLFFPFKYTQGSNTNNAVNN